VISRFGHATTEQLLRVCLAVTGAEAELVWISEEELAAAGAQPWTHLPCWVPERGEFTGFLEVDTTRAAATGLRCRPITDKVTDTWTWLQRDGLPRQRSNGDVHGLPAELEDVEAGAQGAGDDDAMEAGELIGQEVQVGDPAAGPEVAGVGGLARPGPAPHHRPLPHALPDRRLRNQA